MITYGVILLTVFVDLIAAVGIGLFVANIMTVTRLSELQSNDVSAVTDPDNTDLELSTREKEILRNANGKIMLLHLRGSMIFGSSRAITRKNSQFGGCHTLVVDITDVKHLGVSAALALEESILEMVNAKRSVYIVTSKEQALKRLAQLDVLKNIPEENIIVGREVALERVSAKQS